MTLYLRLLDVVFRWAWRRVPWFAEYAVEYVSQVQRRVHGKMLTKDWIAKAREALSKSDPARLPDEQQHHENQ